MDTSKKLLTVLAIAAISMGLIGCSSAPTPEPASSPSRVLEVTGHITEIEDGNLSLRAIDQRQFIFSIENPPVSQDFLQDRFRRVAAIHITYRAEEGRLIPLSIEDADNNSVQPSPTPTS